MNKYIRLFNTIKYLKFTQIYYRIFYFVRNRFRKIIKVKYEFTKDSNSTHLKLTDSCEYYSTYKDGKFTMLNLSKKFNGKIDWNFSEYGKLWTYNITYFEYLKEKEDVNLIYDFIENISSVKDGLQPFPISLRGLNWIKFLTKNEIKDKKIDDSLYAQYYILLDNLEYHLLGNHLLENGFSLLFGAYYFKDKILYKKAEEILVKELDEQILDDGGHFELSPMYHQLMLFRVLDCINLVIGNSLLVISENEQQKLKELLISKAQVMLRWLNHISYENGDIPLLNDSANKIAPTTDELNEYAKRLQINQSQITNHQLQNSGYRKVKKENYECILDIGEVGASYIPGHAHADTFNFELHIKSPITMQSRRNEDNHQSPFIVDTGLSTYNTGKQREHERSTKAHNTVEINETNSSEVWAGFRVANRASIVELVENIDHIKATHDGYKKKFNILHTREWKFEDDKIVIKDSLNKECGAIARLHFNPSITIEQIEKLLHINTNFRVKSYNFVQEFNKIKNAIYIEIDFTKELTIEIEIKGNE
tara:strand:- start:19049 stop:20656 length:1608 start_codon:yes stop_codon:yes gene_type:complete